MNVDEIKKYVALAARRGQARDDGATEELDALDASLRDAPPEARALAGLRAGRSTVRRIDPARARLYAALGIGEQVVRAYAKDDDAEPESADGAFSVGSLRMSAVVRTAEAELAAAALYAVLQHGRSWTLDLLDCERGTPVDVAQLLRAAFGAAAATLEPNLVSILVASRREEQLLPLGSLRVAGRSAATTRFERVPMRAIRKTGPVDILLFAVFATDAGELDRLRATRDTWDIAPITLDERASEEVTVRLAKHASTLRAEVE